MVKSCVARRCVAAFAIAAFATSVAEARTPAQSAGSPLAMTCSLAYHAFASVFYPVGVTESVTFTYKNVGDRDLSSVSVRLDYLGKHRAFTDAVMLAKNASASAVHRISGVGYDGSEPTCTVQGATYSDGTTYVNALAPQVPAATAPAKPSP